LSRASGRLLTSEQKEVSVPLPACRRRRRRRMRRRGGERNGQKRDT